MDKHGFVAWRQGERVVARKSVECARCNTRYRNGGHEIRFFPESHGFLCFSCYYKAPLCECGDLAIAEGKCRKCYIDDEKPVK